ncbi:MAG: hypothetical protein HRU34_07990 [Richelia sp.]|nr:hypothetical protein [Richelia sp.]
MWVSTISQCFQTLIHPALMQRHQIKLSQYLIIAIGSIYIFCKTSKDLH